MKKTLKVIASAAVAMSMFTSVAMADDAATTSTTTTTATKTSADFKDLANIDAALKAKIDAMLKAGVFEGTAADSFGINENMTRAQAAKVLDLIYNVKVDMTVKTSSFADVKADDIANGWAIPFIEAAKKAGYIDGKSDTSFDPGAKVTLGEFATMLVKGLGVKPDVTGTPWYADAVKQAVAKNVLPAGTDGSKDATRADLVVGAYSGQQAYADANKPAQVSVASVKATGVKTVQVTLDRDVDTSKATLSLTTAGTVTVAATTKWSDDKKSATLTLTDTVLRAGDYKVTLGGLDASAVKTTTGTFTAQDEVVQKIEFVTASDTIAQANNVIVKLKATNQYGEIASTAAGNYNFYGATKLTKNMDGYLLATVDTHASAAGVGIVTITVINNDSHVTVTKNFTVGTAPILTKMDLGSPQYSSGKSLTGTGDNVKFALNLYDQYGSVMGYDALNIGGTNSLNPSVIWNDYLESVSATTEDDGNNNPVLKISLGKNVDKSGDYNFTVIDQAASATGKINISSSKVAMKVQIGSVADVIAAGDKDVYIPVFAYDAAGNQLSVDDLTSNDNKDRIVVSSSNSSLTRLEQTGSHKGTIHLNNIGNTKNGSVSVSVFIATANVNSTDTKTFTVQGARIPDHFKEITAPGTQITNGGSTAFKYAVVDQYGAILDDIIPVDSQGNANPTSGAINYSVTVQASTYDVSGKAISVIPGTGVNLGSATTTIATTSAPSVTSAVYAGITPDDDPSITEPVKFGSNATILVPHLKTALNDNTYRFSSTNNPINAGAVGSKVDLILRIMKDSGTGPLEITKFTKSVTVVSAAQAEDLNYALNAVPTLYNVLDSGVIPGASTTLPNGGWVFDTTSAGVANIVTKDELTDPTKSRLAREVTISATNKAGEKVGVAKQILSITSSDQNVAKVAKNSSGQAFVLGNKTGTAQIGVTYVTAKGETKTLNTSVTVKGDALSAASVTWDDNGYSDGTQFNAFKNLNVTDSYGRVYEDNVSLNGVNIYTSSGSPASGRAQKYNYLMGVTFSVTNVVGGTVTIDNYGNVNVTGTGTVTFDLTATAPTGKSATVSITSNTANNTTDLNANFATTRTPIK